MQYNFGAWGSSPGSRQNGLVQVSSTQALREPSKECGCSARLRNKLELRGSLLGRDVAKLQNARVFPWVEGKGTEEADIQTVRFHHR